MATFEEDFAQVVDQINAKLKEAADAVKAAREIGDTIGIKWLSAVAGFDPLLEEMDKAGWQTSRMTADC